MALPEGARRARILSSALHQAVNGYDAVRIRAVADAAGVSASAVYHHFSSKDGLLLECLHGWLSEFADQDAIDIIPAAAPYHRLLVVIEWLTEELASTPRLADAVARAYLHATGPAAGKADLVRDKLIQIFVDALRQDQPDRADHNRQVAELVADVWIANILAIAQKRITARDLRRRLEYAISAISRNAGQLSQVAGFGASLSAQGA